jgi:hypothetical protein
MSTIDVDDFIKPPPKAGSGVHPWLFGQACRLRGYGATPEEALEYIRASLDKHRPGRIVPDRELNEAVRSAFTAENERANGPSWPKPNVKAIRGIVETDGALTLDGLKARCPTDPGNLKAEKAVDTLFPGNPLLCLAASPSEAWTFEREQWRGREGNLQFIVPSPMTARFGLTQNGRRSARCLDNVGLRRFLVVEFDMTPKSEFWAALIQRWEKKGITSFDAQASLLVDLATNPGLRVPLACVVHSANKSLQGWFYGNGYQDGRVIPFFQRAVGLGADKATWTRCQLVRLPGGLRENGKRQEVVYLNPAVIIRKEGSYDGNN